MKNLIQLASTTLIIMYSMIGAANGQVAMLSDPFVGNLFQQTSMMALALDDSYYSDDVLVKASFNSYPNPIMGENAKVSIMGLEFGLYEVIIVDNDGNVQFKTEKKVGKIEVKIDLKIYKKIEPGDYWIMILGKEKNYKKKLTVT